MMSSNIVIKSFCFNPFQENTYIIHNGSKRGILIDPGYSSKDEFDILNQYIQKEKIILSLLLLTHTHIDHILGLHHASQHFQLIPYAHHNEKAIFQQAKAHATMLGIADYVEYSGPINWIEENDNIQNPIIKMIIKYTPGHSPGSVCYIFSDANVALVGDVIFQGSIGRTDLPGGSYQTLIASINQHIATLPKEMTLYPGHGLSTTVGQEIATNPFLGYLR